jgi:hypothetical protein
MRRRKMEKTELVMTIARDIFNRVQMPQKVSPLADASINELCAAYQKIVENIEKVYETLNKLPFQS